MIKQKIFKGKPRIESNSGKLTSWLTTETDEQPVVVHEVAADAIIIDDEEDDNALDLADIPEVPERSTRSKRNRNEINRDTHNHDSGDGEHELSVPEYTSKRRKRSQTSFPPAAAEAIENEDEVPDDKKKLALNTSYEGFSIYGRILCLVVKRRGRKSAAAPASSQQMLENWVSTQAAGQAGDDDDEDNG